MTVKISINNPADGLDMMWGMLMTFGQKANIPVLKEYVYMLIQATTQKNSGQDSYKKKKDIKWDELDAVLWGIIIEASALVLSGKLDEIEEESKK